MRTPAATRRRALALLGAAALAAAAVVVTRDTESGDAGATDPGRPDPVADTAATERWLDETIAFRLATPPDGWVLDSVAPIRDRRPNAELWQLFGEAIGVPDGGVLVGTTVGTVPPEPAGEVPLPDEAVAVPPLAPDDPTHTVRGLPGEVASVESPSLPGRVLSAHWVEGGLGHQALAIGVTEDEMIRTLDSLVLRADSAIGFDPPDDASLPELAQATPGLAPQSVARYRTSGGHLQLLASPTDVFGGLLHLLAGHLVPGGWVLPGEFAGSWGGTSVTVVRDDGWTVTAVPVPSPGHDGLVTLVEDLAPVSRREAIAVGVAQAEALTTTVGDWTVRVHGTDDRDTALCITPRSGDEVCTTADAATSQQFAVASAPVDDGWVVVTVDDGSVSPIATAGPEIEELRGEVGHADGRRVEVYTVPSEADTVVVNRSHDSGPTITYLRPTG